MNHMKALCVIQQTVFSSKCCKFDIAQLLLFIIYDNKIIINLQVAILIRLGGSTVKECVRRFIDRLLTVGMQRKFNRTGTSKKFKFANVLETIVKRKFHSLLLKTGANITYNEYFYRSHLQTIG